MNVGETREANGHRFHKYAENALADYFTVDGTWNVTARASGVYLCLSCTWGSIKCVHSQLLKNAIGDLQ